ncbi:hypothetical protein LBMAG42_41050 [Deltaproteobacteria bacterium]|nr:hypothetical protein LBMAG42_41050 [Deltaproteobacteria bacterium]
MHAYVVIDVLDGSPVALVPGDIVGRSSASALQVDDGRVSEAHAMISLREGELQLLPLRGALAVAGEPVPHAALRPGLEVELARGVVLRILEVHLPESVLGIEGEGLPRQSLPSVASLVFGGRPRLVSGWRGDSAAQLWSAGDSYRLRVGATTREVEAGDELEVEGRVIRFVSIPLGEAGPRTTRRHGDFGAPLHIVARYDTVHVTGESNAPVVFAGMQARLLSELVAMDGPVPWTVLTAELWPGEEDAAIRRGRLDALMLRLRRRLRAVGLRADLVRADGSGTVELVRYPSDRVEDFT